jgi:uncharacterized protein HemY
MLNLQNYLNIILKFATKLIKLNNSNDAHHSVSITLCSSFDPTSGVIVGQVV